MASFLVLLAASSPALAQYTTPYTIRYGPKEGIKPYNVYAPVPKAFWGSGVFNPGTCVMQTFAGKTYRQPADFVLPVANPDLRIYRVEQWDDGAEWVQSYQIIGRVRVEYSLTVSEAK